MFGFFGRLPDTLQRHVRSPRKSKPRFCSEKRCIRSFDQRVVEIVATLERLATGGFTAYTPWCRSSIDMSNVPPPRSYTAIVLLSFVLTVSQRRRGRLVDDAHTFEARDAARVLSGLSWASSKYAGTVMTALGHLVAEIVLGGFAHGGPKSSTKFRAGEYCLPRTMTAASPFCGADNRHSGLGRQHGPEVWGRRIFDPSNALPHGWCFRDWSPLAVWQSARPIARHPRQTPPPTAWSRNPSALAITTVCSPVMIETQELVVPRSIPMTLLIS